MNIAQEDIALALKIADRKRKDLMVSFRPSELEAYKATLANVAKSANLANGGTLSADDKRAMLQGYTNAMNSMADMFALRASSTKKEVNALQHVMAASDYLIALTMSELNQPEFDLNREMSEFYQSLFSVAEKICEDIPYPEINTNQVFDRQRGVDAKDLNEKLKGLIEDINQDCTSQQVGELYAEYQALSKRQKNHTAIWRFFHRGENNERTALLNTMKGLLNDKVPDGALDDFDKDPKDIMCFHEKQECRSSVSTALTAREISFEKSLQLKEYKNDAEKLQSLDTNKANIQDLLKVNYRPNFDRLYDEIELLGAYYNAAQCGQIWNDDTLEHEEIKLLLSQNYIRATTAEKLGQSPDVERAYSEQDENFELFHSDFVEPTSIPALPKNIPVAIPLPNNSMDKINDDLHNQLQQDIGGDLKASTSKVEAPVQSVPQKEISTSK